MGGRGWVGFWAGSAEAGPVFLWGLGAGFAWSGAGLRDLGERPPGGRSFGRDCGFLLAGRGGQI